MAPPQAAGIPCFDYLGNSYRANTAGFIFGCCLPFATCRITTGVEGHAASSIPSPARTVLYPEPLFYMWVYAASDLVPHPLPDELRFPGWHGEVVADNVAYCDGSARLTQVGELQQFTQQELQQMNFSPQFMHNPYVFLRRGATWSVDTYPAPGALIVTFADAGCQPLGQMWQGLTGWPFDNHTTNECPYSP